jgi:hypothetical protein
MSVKMALKRKSFRTNLAVEGKHARVRAQMHLHRHLLSEPLMANNALKRFAIRMNFDVPIQMTLLGETFAASVTKI